MEGYGQFCPVAQAAEVLTERWTPLVIRELALTGSKRFNDIQRGVPLMSSSLLTKRLRQLEQAGLLERRAANTVWDLTITKADLDYPAVVIITPASVREAAARTAQGQPAGR